ARSPVHPRRQRGTGHRVRPGLGQDRFGGEPGRRGVPHSRGVGSRRRTGLVRRVREAPSPRAGPDQRGGHRLVAVHVGDHRFAREPDTELPSSVRMALSAGEALAIELFELFQRRFGLPLLDGLGSTEALHHVTCNRPDDIVLGSVGPPLDGYEVQALDRDRQPVPEGESGELWLRGPTTFAGYWRRPELTARAYLGDWVRTGDMVRITDGRVFRHGRLDDLIKVGGVWMAPVEVEDVLRGHPDVIDAAVVATDDREGVPVLRAFVVSRRKDADLGKELKRLCRRRLATFKVPKFYEMVDELPRTP